MSSTPGKPWPQLDAAAFRQACGRFATGVAIATVKGRDGQPYGLTVNSFTSVSLSPPLVLICVDHKATALPHFRSSNFFAIHILDAGQEELSNRFAQRQADRFRGVDWAESAEGQPILGGTLAVLECAVSQVVEAGDHAIFLGEVMRASVREGPPLLYYSGGYRMLPADQP